MLLVCCQFDNEVKWVFDKAFRILSDVKQNPNFFIFSFRGLSCWTSKEVNCLHTNSLLICCHYLDFMTSSILAPVSIPWKKLICQTSLCPCFIIILRRSSITSDLCTCIGSWLPRFAGIKTFKDMFSFPLLDAGVSV